MRQKKYHFQLRGKEIVCWNGNKGWTTVIAHIVEPRLCKHLLRHSQLAEDIEGLMDVFVSETCGISPAVCPELPEEDEVKRLQAKLAVMSLAIFNISENHPDLFDGEVQANALILARDFVPWNKGAKDENK